MSPHSSSHLRLAVALRAKVTSFCLSFASSFAFTLGLIVLHAFKILTNVIVCFQLFFIGRIGLHNLACHYQELKFLLSLRKQFHVFLITFSLILMLLTAIK